MPARPRPNFFSAARRVTDCAMLLVSSSNLLFIFFPFVVFGVGLLLFRPRISRRTRTLGILIPLRPCPSAPSAVNHCFAVFVSLASALFATPMHAGAMPVRSTPNFLSAARRVTDWAIALVSSSNLVFILFLSFWLLGWFVSLCRENDRVTCGSAFAHLLIRRKKMAVTLS